MEYEIQALPLGWLDRLYICFVDKDDQGTVKHLPMRRFWWHPFNVCRWSEYLRNGRPLLDLHTCPRVNDDCMPGERFLYIKLDRSGVQMSDVDVSTLFENMYTVHTFVQGLNEGIVYTPWTTDMIRKYRFDHGLCPQCGVSIGFDEDPSCTEVVCADCTAIAVDND